MALDIYVDPAGDDANPGTIGSPILTVQEALDRIAAEVNRDQDFNVYLAAGVYEQSATLAIDDTHGPNAPYWTTIAGASAATTTISGGTLITGWADNAGTFEVTLAAVAAQTWYFRDLWVDDVRAQRCRSPKSTWHQCPANYNTTTNPYGQLPFDGTAVTGGLTADGNLELVWATAWYGSRAIVDSINYNANGANKGVVVAEYPQNTSYRTDHGSLSGGFGTKMRLENHASLLTDAGEWYLNRSSGLLQYKPLPGQTVGGIVVYAPVIETIIQVTDAARIRFETLEVAHANWDIPTYGFAGASVGRYRKRDTAPSWPPYPQSTGTWTAAGNAISDTVQEDHTPYAIQIETSSDIHFTDCRIRHTSSSGIQFGMQCRHVSIEKCWVNDIGGNGICLGEYDETRRINNQIWFQYYPQQATSDGKVRNCIVSDCGHQQLGGVGIYLPQVRACEVTNNEIHTINYAGIACCMQNYHDAAMAGLSACRGNLIAANKIHDCMQLLHDGGGIYTVGHQPGNQFIENVIYDIPEDDQSSLHRAGIYIDQTTKGDFEYDVQFVRNVVYDAGSYPVQVNYQSRCVLRENILSAPDGTGEHIRNAAGSPANWTAFSNVQWRAADFSSATYQHIIDRAGCWDAPTIA